MATIKDLATAESEQALTDFLSTYPAVDRDKLARRWDGGIWLWQNRTVRRISGTDFAYEVRCTQPQQKNPGEQMSYTVTLRGDANTFTCECPDWLYRGGICRHMIAAWCFITYGQRGRDWDFEAWLDKVNAEAQAGEDAGERLLEAYERSIAG
jgi:hypothetical protein